MDKNGNIKYSAEFDEGALNKLRDELDTVTL